MSCRLVHHLPDALGSLIVICYSLDYGERVLKVFKKTMEAEKLPFSRSEKQGLDESNIDVEEAREENMMEVRRSDMVRLLVRPRMSQSMPVNPAFS